MSSPSNPNTPRGFEPLQVPPAAVERGGLEILRAAIINDGLHVTLRPVFDDTRMWGRVLADIARQLAHAYEHQERGSADEVMAGIRAGFDADMAQPPQVHGEIKPLT
jgi:hypothetical protein